MSDPTNAKELLKGALRHPASRELGSAGLLFLPGRYMPVGWAATWAAGRLARRFIDPPVDVLDPTSFDATRQRRDVTPDRR